MNLIKHQKIEHQKNLLLIYLLFIYFYSAVDLIKMLKNCSIISKEKTQQKKQNANEKLFKKF